MKKYELIATTFNGSDVFQIKALQDTPSYGVKTGDLGGYIHSEKNLSHEGTCWVGKGARVFDSGVVYEDAVVNESVLVCGHASVYGSAFLTGKAIISERATVRGYAQIWGKVLIHGNTVVEEHAEVWDEAEIAGDVVIGGEAHIHGSAIIRGNSHISGKCRIRGKVHVRNGKLSGEVIMNDQAKVVGAPLVVLDGEVKLAGQCMVGDNAIIKGNVYISEQCGVFDNAIIEATDGHLKLRGKTLIRELVHLDVHTTKTLLDEVLNGDVLLTFEDAV